MLSKKVSLQSAYIVLLCGILGSIVFSKLNLNSALIMLLLVNRILQGKNENAGWEKTVRSAFPFFVLFSLLYLFGIFYASSTIAGWKYFESTLGYIVIPLVICSSELSTKSRQTVMLTFCIAVTVAAVLCLGYAAYSYYHSANLSVFFYHDLLRPLKHHAVYFSTFVFVCLTFLVFEFSNRLWVKNHPIIYIGWIFLLLVFLVLLSSKMILILLIASFAAAAIFKWKAILKRKIMWLIVAPVIILLAILLTLSNPLKQRFTNLFEGNLNVLEQKSFQPSDYFNGFQFRVLLWRVTYEVLNERHAWLFGVSPANAQDLLRHKYAALNLYPGDGKTNNGYFNYNCHNQFLQTTLQSGIVGLAVLLLLLGALIVRSVRRSEAVLSVFLILLICFFFTESVLERQYGMILVTVLPLIYIYSKPSKLTVGNQS
jgi:O-antigen ligase